MSDLSRKVSRQIEDLEKARARLTEVLPRLGAVPRAQDDDVWRELRAVDDHINEIAYATGRLRAAIERSPDRVINMDGYDSSMTVLDWMLAHSDTRRWVIHTTRLAGSWMAVDGADSGGPLIPFAVLAAACPLLRRRGAPQEIDLTLAIDSHGFVQGGVGARWVFDPVERTARLRLTSLDGGSSPLLHEEHAGSLAVFAFRLASGADTPECRVWICRSAREEEDFELAWGPLEFRQDSELAGARRVAAQPS